MLFVGHEQLDGWGVSADRAFEQALANVAGASRGPQAVRPHPRAHRGRPTVAFQSREGWASSLLLLPDALVRVLGDRNGLLLAPMRDLILCLPLDAEHDFAQYLLDEFAAVDMNALDLPPVALVDGHLSYAVGVPQSVRRDHPGQLVQRFSYYSIDAILASVGMTRQEGFDVRVSRRVFDAIDPASRGTDAARSGRAFFDAMDRLSREGTRAGGVKKLGSLDLWEIRFGDRRAFFSLVPGARRDRCGRGEHGASQADANGTSSRSIEHIVHRWRDELEESR